MAEHVTQVGFFCTSSYCRYSSAWPFMHLYMCSNILYSHLNLIGNQWKCLMMVVRFPGSAYSFCIQLPDFGCIAWEI